MSTASLAPSTFRAPTVTVPVARPRATVPPTASQWTEPGTSAYLKIRIALFLAGFSSFSLIYAVQPLLPSLAVEFGRSPSESSLALSLTTGFLALSIFCAGMISETTGRRSLMFASMAGGAVLHVVCAVTTDWTLLLALRAVEGFVLGGVPAVAMAYLAEEIHPKSLGSTMGLYVGGTAFGAMMGRVGMGLLTEFASWRIALGTLGVIDLLAAIGFILLLPASRNFIPKPRVPLTYHRDAWIRHLRTPGLPLLFVIGFVTLGILVTTFNYISFRLSAPPFSYGETTAAMIFTVYIFGVVVSPIAGRLADRFGRGVVLLVGLTAIGAGLLVSLGTSLLATVAGVTLVTLGFFTGHSVASGWVGRMAVGCKGHASSLYLLAYYLGSSTMGSTGGWFWSAGGWPAVIAFNGVLLAIALVVGGRLHWIERRGVTTLRS